MKIFSRKLLALTLTVAIMATVCLPVAAQAQTRQRQQQPQLTVSSVSIYPEFTPDMEKYMEKFYWEVMCGKAVPYMKGPDGFSKREAIRIVALFILEEFDCYPGGAPGDVSAREWQRHWDNFFWRIAKGEFSDKELRRAFRRWKHLQHRARRHRR